MPMLPLRSLRRPHSVEPVVWCHPDCEEVIGRGCSGSVRLARTRSTGSLCAVKAVSKENWYEAALREARILKLLAGHAGIIRLLETFEDDSCVYLVLEYVEGGELLDDIVLRKEGSQTNERRVAGIMQQVFEALAFCHDEHQVVHRDVKPENILVERGQGHEIPRTRLIDFGCAALPNEHVEFAGTLPYMAPEAVKHCGRSSVSSAVDSWSTGVVLHALLIGQLLPKDVQVGRASWTACGDEWIYPGAPSPLACDLLSGLLRQEPQARLSAAEAALHPWISVCLESVQDELQSKPDAMRLPVLPRAAGYMTPESKGAARLFAQAAGPKIIRSLLKQLSVLDLEPEELIWRCDADAMLRTSQVNAASPLGVVGDDLARQALSTCLGDGSDAHVLQSTWCAWLEIAAHEASSANNLDAALLALEANFSCKRPASLSDVSTQAPTPRADVCESAYFNGAASARCGGA